METGESLLEIRGGLWISSARRGSKVHVEDFFDRTRAAARRFGIPHEVLDAADIRRRFPVFKVKDDEQGYFEPGAGLVRPEACVRTQLALAERLGADLHAGERVDRIAQRGDEVVVTTNRGEYVAKHAVISAGAGAVDLLPPEITRLLTITRQAQYWFAANGHQELPVWIWELQESNQGIYGFPAIDGAAGGVKVATEQFLRTTTPESIDRDIGDEEKRALHRELIAPHIPGLSDRCVKAAACMYTATPDFQFWIDRHPGMPNVVIVSACSGHGFKHSAAIGEKAATMTLRTFKDG